ncbi:MAG: hypothetical protein ACD_73C00599G0001 [uncultured bacterium]|nr:MAG: hypothetical protein ACD_73C00599G0001 [uncultured bacterium]
MSDLQKKSLDMLKAAIISRVSDGYKVFLFGSHATDDALPDSDIDIGFLGNKKIDKKILTDIRSFIEESIIPYKVDLVDFFGKQESFKKEALKKIVLWKS